MPSWSWSVLCGKEQQNFTHPSSYVGRHAFLNLSHPSNKVGMCAFFNLNYLSGKVSKSYFRLFDLGGFQFFSPSFSSISVHHVSSTSGQEEVVCDPHPGTVPHHRTTGRQVRLEASCHRSMVLAPVPSLTSRKARGRSEPLLQARSLPNPS